MQRVWLQGIHGPPSGYRKWRENLTFITHAHREKFVVLASFHPWFTLLLRVCRILPMIGILAACATLLQSSLPPTSYSATSL